MIKSRYLELTEDALQVCADNAKTILEAPGAMLKAQALVSLAICLSALYIGGILLEKKEIEP